MRWSSTLRSRPVTPARRPDPMDRPKLSFFGATKFDPKSNRWTRITMYQQAPLAEELHNDNADDWCFPVVAVEPHRMTDTA